VSLAETVREFCAMQRELIRELRRIFPQSTDLRLLLDFPRAGSLLVLGDSWAFNRHGLGFRFRRLQETPGAVVDAHDHFPDGDFVDGWRLGQYLESVGKPVDEDELEAQLERLCESGELTRAGKGYRLGMVPPSRVN
jgi:hypothetical protein